MKRNIFSFFCFLCLAIIPLFSSCNYLDIVPDERATEEDAYKDVNAARGFLYSCYGYMPNPISGDASLDFMTGDEVVTSFEHETFANFPKGNFTAVNPIISYWNTLYGGIRQSYTLLKNLDRVPGIEPYKEEFIAELNFLIGYYHMLLFRCYGPIIIVNTEIDINTKPEQYLGRSSLEQCVSFICNQFDLAISSKALPARRTGIDTGRATTVAAMALKAYTLMYYASPLFNGNQSLSQNMKDPNSSELISAVYDQERWVNASKAYKAAIDAAEAAGHALFTDSNSNLIENSYPQNKTLRILRGNLCTKVKYNTENIWTKAQNEGPYGLQKKSMPFIDEQNYNGVAPTMNMIRRFYTKNGLPFNVDPETKEKKEFEVVNLNKENSVVHFKNGTSATIALAGQQTSYLNLNREPRYYAWIAFQNGFYEVRNASYNGGYTNNPGNIDGSMKDKVIITDFTVNGNCGRKQRNNNYSPTGFLNKKGVHPDNECAKNQISFRERPWPIIRLAELYLGYAECCAESGDIETAKYFLNKVRQRAGIPDVEISWAKVGGIQDSRHLVDIIRQERQIELYLENHNFWDMRRWLLAEKYFNHKHTGMNIVASNIEEFSKETEVPFLRSFRKDAHYLLPIPARDINNNHNIYQNPGY